MFVILQKYDFSSKSQQWFEFARHPTDVCDTAKVRFFKQITTSLRCSHRHAWCLWYCKSTIFQANHNRVYPIPPTILDVCDTAKVRFFKQITTFLLFLRITSGMFVILQKYDFSSKSQLGGLANMFGGRCLWYCKSTIFQANHNRCSANVTGRPDVCDTAKVRFFKQITTGFFTGKSFFEMFVILQKYDFSSKSQRCVRWGFGCIGCLWYCKSTIFQANHNAGWATCARW